MRSKMRLGWMMPALIRSAWSLMWASSDSDVNV